MSEISIKVGSINAESFKLHDYINEEKLFDYFIASK